MKHLFLDTNVVLDFLGRREPFAEDALEIFRAGLEQRARLYVASLSFSTIFYTSRKQSNSQQARSLVTHLEQLVSIVAVDAAIVQQAIAGPFGDFEDGLQHGAAISLPQIEAIVTRDASGFKASVLPVLTPPQTILLLSSL